MVVVVSEASSDGDGGMTGWKRRMDVELWVRR